MAAVLILALVACGGGNKLLPTGTPTATPILPAPTAVSGLVVECTLDEVKLRISCSASGYQAGSQLTWTSTASYANNKGGQWQFTIDKDQIGLTEQVFLEICQGSTCETNETPIDTSALAYTTDATATSAPTRPPSNEPSNVAEQTPLGTPSDASDKMPPQKPNPARKPQRILILPFTAEDEPQGIIPMGETILHPPPHNPFGHPGIDFQWPHKGAMVVALTGKVGEIRVVEGHETIMSFNSVSVITDEYIVTYNVVDLYSVNPGIAVGSQVIAGQTLGYAIPVTTEDTWHSTHWEFGLHTKVAEPKPNPEGVTELYETERLCPLPYFTQSEEERLLRLWGKAIYDDRDQFPDLCNAHYKNP